MLVSRVINKPKGGFAMRKIIRLNFEGQQIYVGIDVHKKSWSISILTEEFEHKTFTNLLMWVH